MARRGGFFSRIVNAVRSVVAPRPEREREAPPEPTGRQRDREYREIWRSHNGQGNYRKHLRTFHAIIDSIEEDEDEREAIWDSYVRNMTAKNRRYRFNSPNNPFWRMSGIDPDNFRWDRWREAMGYVGKRRSRS